MGVVDGKDVYGFVDIAKTIYVFTSTRTVKEALNVRSVYGSTAEDTVVGQLDAGVTITLTALAVDSNGNVWGQLQSCTDKDGKDVSGNWVNLTYTQW